MSKTQNRPRRDVENSRAPRDGGNHPSPPSSSKRPWTWLELCEIWDHPDWTAKELVDRLPGRTPKAIERARDRYGRYKSGRAPICWRCGQRPVWTESPYARKLGLCMGCYQDEERMREADRKRNDALRQRRMRERRRK